LLLFSQGNHELGGRHIDVKKAVSKEMMGGMGGGGGGGGGRGGRGGRGGGRGGGRVINFPFSKYHFLANINFQMQRLLPKNTQLPLLLFDEIVILS
jgi:hypothetical protein